MTSFFLLLFLLLHQMNVFSLVFFVKKEGRGQKHSDTLLAMDNHPTVTSLLLQSEEDKSGKGE